MSINAILLLAEGFEEIEATTVIDVLRRAKISINSASLGSENTVTGARGIKIVADLNFDDIKHEIFDLVVLPGGIPGADHLREDPRMPNFLKNHFQNDKKIAAICAAPYVLGELGFLENLKATSYPTFRSKLGGATAVDEKVVVDGQVITSQGVGTALDFALELVKIFCGKEMADDLAKAMIMDA